MSGGTSNQFIQFLILALLIFILGFILRLPEERTDACNFSSCQIATRKILAAPKNHRYHFTKACTYAQLEAWFVKLQTKYLPEFMHNCITSFEVFFFFFFFFFSSWASSSRWKRNTRKDIVLPSDSSARTICAPLQGS